MKIIFRLFIFFIVILFVNSSLHVSAEAVDNDSKRVLLLVADRLSLDEFLAFAGPVLNELTDRGGMALVNTRGGRPGSESSYLSMGVGVRAAAGHMSRLSFNRSEEHEGHPAETIYYRYTGREPGGEIFNLSLPVLQAENAEPGYIVVPGVLGSALSQAGKKIAVFGNADTDVMRRTAVLIAMDKYGSVPLGNISGQILKSDPFFPYGKRIDVGAITEGVSDSFAEASLVVVDWGDFTRVDENSGVIDPARKNELMELSFAGLDSFLSSFEHQIGRSTLFIMAVPSPPKAHLASGRQLTPMVVAGGEFTPGLISSPTTRREGLVANIDLASTILDHLEVERPRHIGGIPMHSVSHGYPREFLGSMLERVVPVYGQRPVLLRGYLTFLTIILLAGALGLAFAFIRRLRKIFSVLLEAIMVFPLVLLILASIQQFPPESLFITVTVIISLIIGVLFLLSFLKRLNSGRMMFWSVLGMVTSLFILTDLFYGATLQKFSFLGYDPAAGARYYGMGNEYMGVIIGATVLGTTAFLEVLRHNSSLRNYTGMKEKKIFLIFISLIVLYYLVVIFAMASPSYGANVGGTIAASVAFGVAAAGIIRVSTGFRFAPAVFIGSFVLIVIMMWGGYHYFGTGEHWHLQSFWNQWQSGDLAGAGEVIRRKISMNLKLLRYSIWAYALIAFMGLLVMLFFYPVGRMKKLKREHHFLFAGIMAVLAGSIAALLLNDSGVVAAATTLLFGVPPLLIYYLGVNKDDEEKKEAEVAY